MKEITFHSPVPAILNQIEEWKAANPHVKIIDLGAPFAGAHVTGGAIISPDLPIWIQTVRY